MRKHSEARILSPVHYSEVTRLMAYECWGICRMGHQAEKSSWGAEPSQWFELHGKTVEV